MPHDPYVFFTFFFAACCVKRHHVLNSSLIVAWYEERKNATIKRSKRSFCIFAGDSAQGRSKHQGFRRDDRHRSTIFDQLVETGSRRPMSGGFFCPFKASIWTRPSASNRSKIQSSDTDPVIANAFCGHNGTLQNQELRQVLPPLSPVMA